MSTLMAFLIGIQLLTALAFAIVGLVAVIYRRRALQREIQAVGAERWPLEAYQRFVAARVRISSVVTRVNGFVLLVSVVGIVLGLIFLFGDIPDFLLYLLLYILSGIALIMGFFIGSYIHDIVGTVFVDAEAMRLSQMSSLRQNEIFILRMKFVLFRVLPMLLYLEALLIVESPLVEGGPVSSFALSLLVLGVLGLTIGVIRILFAVPLYTLTASLRPIEQTQWAFLIPRIAAWARLAEVEIASVQIQQEHAVGTINVRLIGLGRPTMVISEAFLRYCEWRQQDAMIAIVFGLQRGHVSRNVFFYRLFPSLMAIVFLVLDLFVLRPLLSSSDVSLLFLALFCVLMAGVQSVYRSSQRAAYFNADRIASFLTGDPIAVMVVLNVVNALCGLPVASGGNTSTAIVLGGDDTFGGGSAGSRASGIPSRSERIQRLDILIRQPWSRAPQAAMPVPACTAVSFGQYFLTAPLAQATAPGPVPPVPYASLV